MDDIYKISSSDVVGGPGRLVWAPFGTAVPTKISDVMDLASPYNLKNGWKDLGATNDGITISRGFDTEDIEVDQSLSPIGSDITGWTHTLATQLAENTVENRQMALIGSAIVETPPTLGVATTLTAAVVAGATILQVTSAAGFTEGAFLQVGDEIKKINTITGTSIYLSEPVTADHAANDSVTPVTELGYKRIGYGAVEDRPEIMVALISQKKNGTLYMAVFRKCMVSGDSAEQAFNKGTTRYLPLNMVAYPVDGVPTDENVYFEIDQVR